MSTTAPVTDDTPTQRLAESERLSLAVQLIAVDPMGLGGLVLRGADARVVQQLVAQVAALLATDDDDDVPVRRVPLGVSDDRLLGGIDLAGTLAAGRVVRERGVLAAADGGVVVLPSAERATAGVLSALIGALDAGQVIVERDGVASRDDARIVLVACDDHHDDEAPVAAALADRLAVHADGTRLSLVPDMDVGAVRRARARRQSVTLDVEAMQAICVTAELCGVAGTRATLLAARAARAAAALAGRDVVSADDVTLACAIVLAPRATRVPAAPPEPSPDEAPPEPPPPADAAPDAPPSDTPEPPPPEDRPLDDIVREATVAAIPPDLLAALLARAGAGVKQQGRVGDDTSSLLRGRPRGARRGDPRGGARLHVIETLRAAAPWQRVRGRATHATGDRVAIRRDDFRVRRFIERTGTTVIFAVDASGSSAIARLGEAKGAIELLLAESYARRDRVSLLAFRGTTCEELLPPTRALARARRVLAALPGGGGTPLATAIDRAAAAGIAARRAGTAPVLVFLTDARANIARDGAPGRPQAQADALVSAAALRAQGLTALFIDTSPRPDAFAQRVAEALGARYVPLPSADARAMATLVRGVADAAG
ncbi:MAG: magnesium chelatase subunit D [Gemmatimonadaceae bacterium]|nr:magnesium chelatase subunit D [Gemmatimonadaceae bacterium]